MEAEYVETQKGGRALITSRFRYLSIRKGTEGREFWRCCLRSCKARVITLCKTAAIAFVPLQFVRPAWDGIAQELDEEEGLEGFKTYFHQTWMRGSYQLVNYYTYDGPRTNNRLEGWHSRLKRIVKKPHPNIYELIDVFRSEEAATNVTISQLTTGANPPPCKKKYTAIDSRVEKLKDRMHNGQVSINDYIAAIGHIVGL